MKKSDLIEELKAKNIDFPAKASVADLRKLYADTIGRQKPTTTTTPSDSTVNQAGGANLDANNGQNDSAKNQDDDALSTKSNNSNADPVIVDDLDDIDGNIGNKSKDNAGISQNVGAHSANFTKHRSAHNSDIDSSDNEEKEQAELDGLLLSVPKTPAAIKLHELQIEEDLIDAKLRIMEKKKRLMEYESSIFTPFAHQIMRPSYKDIKHLVPLFSGSDDYDAHKWLADFERACDAINADSLTRLKFFRQSMKSDCEAELFLRTDTSATYSDIRNNFLANFGHIYSVSEVIDRLRRTTFSSAKTTVMGYILKMQEIASRANIDELQTVQFIIDGFQDNSPHIAIFYPAQNIAQLKTLAHRYAQLRELVQSASAIPSVSGVRGKVKLGSTSASNSAGGSSAPEQRTQCFNCSGIGHLSKDCTAPKREKGSCFRCGSAQHQLKDCPKPKPTTTNNRVALINAAPSARSNESSVSELGRALDEANVVSVTFLTKGCVHVNEDFLSLFDSGSPISLMKYSAVPKQLIPNKDVKYSGYDGLGRFKLCTYGVISIQIQFRNIVKIIAIYVIPDNFISYPILLGRNFMRAFGIKLSIAELIPNTISKPIVEVKLQQERNKIRISEQVLHCVYNSFGDKESIDFSECELCRRMPNAVMVTCDSLTVVNSEMSDNNIDSAISQILAIDLEQTNVLDSESFDISPKLNIFHREAIERIIQTDYLDLDKIPPVKHNYSMQIRLSSDIPISFPPRRLSYADKQIVDRTIDELIRKGIIRHSNSPYAFPIVLVPKKDDKRMCVDYRPLNKIMVRDSFPLPLIDDCLERMEGKRYFTTLDLKNGFHQIQMADNSIPYTAFVTPTGQYEYVKMPFGLRNGPGVFQRFINH